MITFEIRVGNIWLAPNVGPDELERAQTSGRNGGRPNTAAAHAWARPAPHRPPHTPYTSVAIRHKKITSKRNLSLSLSLNRRSLTP